MDKDFEKELETEKKILGINDIFTNIDGTSYRIVAECMIKDSSNGWVQGYIYQNVDSSEYFVRDAINFINRFCK